MRPQTSFITLLGLAALTSAPALAGPSCEEWASYSQGHQAVIMSGVFEREIFESLPASTRDCMRSIEHPITIHATELCEVAQADFDRSTRRAMISAVQYCQTR